MNDPDTSGNPGPSHPLRKCALWLWNPFLYTAGGLALTVGIVVILFAGGIGSLSNTHFDGVLDTHTGHPAPLWFFLGEGIINWLCLSIVLLGAGYLLARSKHPFRAIDLLGTQALARWPFVVVALICLLPGYGRFSDAMVQQLSKGDLSFPRVEVVDVVVFGLVVMVMLVALVWFVALAWKSFRVSCDLKGGKAVTMFIIGILVAEVLSKIAIIKGLGTFL